MRKSGILIIIIMMALFCAAAMSKEMILETFQISKDQANKKCSSEIENFKLCIVSDELSIKPGEKATFNILITNVGSEDIKMSNQPPIEINLYDEKGEKIPTILQTKAKEKKLTRDDFKKIITQASISHRYEIILKSQQSWKTVIDLSDDYDLNKRGTYFVEVKAKLSDKQQRGFIELTLDKIEVTVK